MNQPDTAVSVDGTLLRMRRLIDASKPAARDSEMSLTCCGSPCAWMCCSTRVTSGICAAFARAERTRFASSGVAGTSFSDISVRTCASSERRSSSEYCPPESASQRPSSQRTTSSAERRAGRQSIR